MLLKMEDKYVIQKRKVRQNLPGIRLEALVVAKDLTGGSSGHRRQKQRVPETSLGDLGLQGTPVPQICRSSAPEVELELSLLGGTAFPGFVGAISGSYLGTGLKSTMVDGLEDLDVQFLGGLRVERHAESHESISETLNTNTNRSVAHVRSAGFWDGVVVDVDDAVKVIGDDLGNFMELLEVVFAILDE